MGLEHFNHKKIISHLREDFFPLVDFLFPTVTTVSLRSLTLISSSSDDALSDGGETPRWARVLTGNGIYIIIM